MTAPSNVLSMETTSAEARAFLERSRETLQQLAVLIRNSYLHDLTNQVFEEPLARLVQSISQLVLTEGSFRLEGFGEEFFANGTRIRMEFRSLSAYKFVLNELAKRGVGGIFFESRPTLSSVTAFLEVFCRAREGDGGSRLVDRLNDELLEREVKGIRLLPLRDELSVAAAESELGASRRERALNAYQQALDFIRDSMMSADSPAQVNVRKAKRTVQNLVDLSYEEGNGFSLAGMASIKAHDDYTFNHMVNVCVLAIAFGQRLGLQRHSLAQLGLSALYHDMGKLHIPLEVLNKSNGFSEEEWAVMGNHTIYAARTLFPLIVVDRTTVNRILTSLQHHLRYDGTGYPRLRIRRKQSLYARITAIVDTFDAMTTKRIYQRQYLPDEAIAVMHQSAGARYDPLLVKAFINCMGIYPVGSTVVLRSEELAVVVESNPDTDHLHQPRIRIVTDPGRAHVPPFLVDLSQPGEEPRAILHCVDPEEFGITSARYAF
jgi:HD-GYP domain-containing protein (c-di-GMP phosphodiesterase class II)